MPYVQRTNGGVCGVYANAQPGFAEEWLGDADPAVVAYRNPPPSTNPNDYPLRPDQFFAMLDIAGLTASVNAALDAISDPTAKAIAKAKFNHTQVFNRSNPLFETLKAGVGVTDAQIDAMWMQAKDIP
jgi:hypothetical protein